MAGPAETSATSNEVEVTSGRAFPRGMNVCTLTSLTEATTQSSIIPACIVSPQGAHL